MRSVNDRYSRRELDHVNPTSLKGMAEIAHIQAQNGEDSYSDYRVGAALLMRYKMDEGKRYLVYGGSNINLSGMEIKIHAEQLAIYQAIMDIQEHSLHNDATIRQMVVVTNEHDLALRCGHCLQVTASLANYVNQDILEDKIRYIAAAHDFEHEDHKGDKRNNWKYDQYNLHELLAESYINRI